jgi:HAD superfamily hydrolase (TIGR01484 family)
VRESVRGEWAHGARVFHQPSAYGVPVERIELVVTDLDGTFWDEGQQLHPRTAAAVEELARRGIGLIAATGRRRRSAEAGYRRAGITLPTVLLNGSHGHDYTTGTDFHATAFTAEDARALFELCAAHGLGPCVYTTHAQPDAYVGPVISTCATHLAMLTPHLGHADLAEVASTHTVLGFSILGRPHDELAELAAAIEASGLAAVAFTQDRMYEGWSLMAAPAGVSKWTGVVAWCELAGFDPERVLAIGDGGNDVELLAAAAVPVTVEGGDARAAAVADHVVRRPDEGGWADLLDLLP